MRKPKDFFLEGKLIVLRSPFAEQHDAAIRAMLSDTLTMKDLRYMTNEPEGWTLDQVRQRRERYWAAQAAGAAMEFQVFCKKTGQLAGDIGLPKITPSHKSALGGIIVHHPFWRQGFCTEGHLLVLDYAFDTLGLNKVTYDTTLENTELCAFYEKFGVERECIRKQEIYEMGRFKDVVDYVFFAEGWPEIKARMKESVDKRAL